MSTSETIAIVRDPSVVRDPSIPGFCARQRISRSSYYNLKNVGKAPREYVVGKLIRISPEAEAEWVLAREAEAEALREAASAA